PGGAGGRRIRLCAVPGDAFGRGVAAGELLTRDAEVTVGGGAHTEHHRMEDLAQLGRPQPWGARLHIPQEVHPGMLQHRAQIALERLDLLVVRCDAVTDQAVRAWQPVQDIDLDVRYGLLFDQGLRGVDTARSRSDDCDSKHGWPLPRSTPRIAPAAPWRECAIGVARGAMSVPRHGGRWTG